MNSETDKHSFQVFCFTFYEFSLFATTVKEGTTEDALGTSSRKLAEETLKRSQHWIEHFAIIQRFFRAELSRVIVDESINHGDDVMMMTYFLFFFRACFSRHLHRKWISKTEKNGQINDVKNCQALQWFPLSFQHFSATSVVDKNIDHGKFCVLKTLSSILNKTHQQEFAPLAAKPRHSIRIRTGHLAGRTRS